MKISINKITDKIVWLLTVTLLSSFSLLADRSWGRYVYISLAATIALLTVLGNSGRLRIQIMAFHGWAVVFVVFIFLSGLWAVYSPAEARASAMSLSLTFVCMAMVYLHYQEKDDVHLLLSAVMWAGYIVAVYTLVYYGYDTLERMAAEASSRMDNEYANVNSIGMAASLACVLQVNELFNKRNRLSALMMIPAILVTAATQSRKAFVMLLGGILAISVLMSLRHQNKAHSVLRMIVVVAVVAIGARYLLELPIFGGVLERMEGLIASLTGEGTGGSSADLRKQMRELGWDVFTEYPIAGVGMSNPKHFAAIRLHHFVYLHNNYVELLSGGGLIGFFAYYAAHIYILISLFKYRKADANSFLIGLVWIAIILVMDYGEVSYPEKLQMFYIMIHFLNVECMKRKYRRLHGENYQTA